MKWVVGKRGISFLLAFSLCLLGGCKYFDPGANFIDDKVVWKKIKKEAPELGLDPSFVYAICHAESSLNANAESSIAKGLMQLTEPAWSDVTTLHYRTAFQWETNVEVGMLYLKRLKGMLESVDLFTYPRLAASYRSIVTFVPNRSDSCRANRSISGSLAIGASAFLGDSNALTKASV